MHRLSQRLVRFPVLWEAMRCPAVLADYLTRAPTDSRLIDAQEFKWLSGLKTDSLDQYFQDRQEDLVRQFVARHLPGSKPVEGETLWEREAETWRDIGWFQSTASADWAFGKLSVDQVLQREGWAAVLAACPVVLDAVFISQGVVVLADALVLIRDSWHLVFTRASTKLKDAVVAETELARWVLERCGLHLGGAWLLHPREGYRRHGELSPDALILKSLHLPIKHLPRPLSRELEGLLGGENRAMACGQRSCPVCGPRQAAYDNQSILTLPKAGSLVPILRAAGLTKLSAIDPESSEIGPHLSPAQRVQITAVRTNQVHVAVPAIQTFVDKLVFPIHCLDFECWAQALPPFDQTTSWELVPGLYSYHRVDSLDDLMALRVAASRSFVAQPGVDQREALGEALWADLGERGTILGFGMALERQVLATLARLFPKLEPGLSGIESRLVDLQEPFANFHFYHPDQRGKLSLKVLVPLLTDLHYDDLIIGDGGQAHLRYYFLSDPEGLPKDQRNGFTGEAGRAAQTKALADYAAMDTLGLIHLLRYLIQTIANR